MCATARSSPRTSRWGSFRQGPEVRKDPRGTRGKRETKGKPGAAGTARAYALGGGSSCQGSAPPFVTCPVLRGKGVAYIVKVATGKYCVGVSGINAAASDSVAIVTVSGPGGGFDNQLFAARWSSSNVACVSTEFEVETHQIIQAAARNTTDTGAVQVSSPPTLSDLPTFTIPIL